jgi:hypothetical protein
VVTAARLAVYQYAAGWAASLEKYQCRLSVAISVFAQPAQAAALTQEARSWSMLARVRMVLEVLFVYLALDLYLYRVVQGEPTVVL